MNNQTRKTKKVGPKNNNIKDTDVEGVDYVFYKISRRITRPALVIWLRKFCDEKNIKASDAVHILAMDHLKYLYGAPPNLLHQIIEAAIRNNDAVKKR